MKKLLIFGLAALLTLAFGSAYAQTEFKASGFLDAEYVLGRNIRSGDVRFAFGAAPPAGFDKSLSFIRSRGRLMFNLNVGKELSGTIFFEIDADPYGSGPGSNSAGSLQRGVAGYWGADRSAVEVKWLFFDVAVPVIPIPITVRIGEQGWGPRGSVFSGDGAGISAGIKLDPIYINPLWAKALEGSLTNADDSDMYGLNVNAKIGKLTVGGFGLYYNFNSYPLSFNSATGAFTGNQKANFWYLGAYTDGKVGPVNINFDFAFEKGRVNPLNADKLKYKGWITKLNVDYPWNKFNFGGGVYYATGDDKNKTPEGKFNGYVIPPGSESVGGFGESLILYGSGDALPSGGLGIINAGSTSFANMGAGGTWWAKVQAKAQVTPAYSVQAKLFYIGDTTKNGNTWGTLPDDKKFVGWEFDLINTIQVYKNLKWTIAGGVMGVGDALKFVDDDGNVRKPKTPWTIHGNLMYNF